MIPDLAWLTIGFIGGACAGLAIHIRGTRRLARINSQVLERKIAELDRTRNLHTAHYSPKEVQ